MFETKCLISWWFSCLRVFLLNTKHWWYDVNGWSLEFHINNTTLYCFREWCPKFAGGFREWCSKFADWLMFSLNHLFQTDPGVQAVPGQLDQCQWQSLLVGWLPWRHPLQPARTAFPVEGVSGGGGRPWGRSGPHRRRSQWLRYGRRVFLQIVEAPKHHGCASSDNHRHHHWEAVDNPAHHSCQETVCCWGQWPR